MSTRSNIAIILRPEDRNKTLNVMDKIFDDCRPNMRCPNCRTPKPNNLETVFPNCEPNGKAVLQIYCHHDGYPEGVGNALYYGYDSYEKALALILGGDVSVIDEKYTCPYSIGEGEDPNWNVPTVLDEPKLVEEYLYVFNYETNEWFVQELGSTEFKSVKEVLREV